MDRPSSRRRAGSRWIAPEMTAAARLGDAGMACELSQEVIEPYPEAVQAKERLPGFAVFPLPFMMDE
jgi:hypothetical protein